MAGQSIDILVQAYLAHERDEPGQLTALEELVSVINQDPSKLIAVVKALAPVLTAEEDDRRAKGVWLLSDVLLKISSDVIKRQEVRTLTDFFTSESSLSPSSCTLPALQALSTLAALPTFGNVDTVQVAEAVFQYIDMRRLVQSTRFKVYTLIDVLLSHHRQALKDMGDSFIVGYCKIAALEKDPRNLKLAFTLDKVILIEFDCKNQINELFDITFCYFPITFTAPKDDPYGISSEDLQDLLRDCLAANPYFAESGLPLFLEKLQATTSSAKRQSLKAIIQCFPVYGKAQVSKVSKKFWDALSVEIFHANDPEIESLSLDALSSLLQTIYSTDDQEQDSNKENSNDKDEEENMQVDKSQESGGIATTIIDACVEEVADPGKNKAKGGSKILAKLIECSDKLGSEVISKTIPLLLRFLRGDSRSAATSTGGMGMDEARQAVFTIMQRLFRSIETVAKTNTTTIDSIVKLKDELVTVLVQTISTKTSPSSATPSAYTPQRTSAIEALVDLIRISNVLAETEARFAIVRLTDVIVLYPDQAVESGQGVELIDQDDEEAGDIALEQLNRVIDSQPDLITDITIKKLFDRLRDPSNKIIGPADLCERPYKRSLVALASLCVHPALLQTFIVRILGKLEEICCQRSSPMRALYTKNLLLTLEQVVKGVMSNNKKNTRTNLLYGSSDSSIVSTKAIKTLEINSKQLIVRLVGMFIVPATIQERAQSVSVDPRLIARTAQILGLITQNLDSKTQTELGSSLISAFGPQGDLASLTDNMSRKQEGVNLVPFNPIFTTNDGELDPQSRSRQESTIIILSSIFTSLRPEAFPDHKNIVQLIEQCLNLAQTWYEQATQSQSKNNLQSMIQSLKYTSTLQMLCSIVNKLGNQSEISSFTNNLIEKWIKDAKSSSKWALVSLSWVAKALVVRGDQRGYSCVDELIQILQLDNDSNSKLVPEMLALIVSSEDGLLIREKFGVKKLMYKQKFYGTVVPKLLQGYETTKAVLFIEALASLVTHAPFGAAGGLEKHVAMLARETTAHGCDERLIREVLDAVATKESSGSQDQLSSADEEELVKTALLNAVQAKDEQTRMAALRCIKRLSNVKIWGSDTKRSVIKGLLPVLDDSRKSVRKDAVDARSSWLALK